MNNETVVFSPFNEKLAAIEICKLDSSTIIDKYKKINIDVAKYFKELSDVIIYECPETKYRFYHPYSIMGDDKFYEELQIEITDYYPNDKDEFKVALREIEEENNILEIGCGDGSFIELARKHFKRINLKGLEFNDKAIEKCRSKKINVEKKSIEEFSINNFEEFDIVVFFQVLEHIQEVNNFLTASISVLKKGGKLILAVPDNSPYYRNFRIHETMNLPPHHIGLWNEVSFKNLEKKFDIRLDCVDYVGNTGYFSNIYYFMEYLLIQNKINKFKFILMPFLLPYAIFKVSRMKINGELKPHCIVCTFTKT